MSYIVLAFGSVMSLIGVLSIAFGYPIIRDERGWASVIAGSMLLSGGVITIALALILKAILDMRAGLARDRAPAMPSTKDAPRAVDFSGLELPAAAAAPAEAPALMTFDPPLPAHEPAQNLVHEDFMAAEETPIDDIPAYAPQDAPLPEPETSDALVTPVEPLPERQPSMDDWLDQSFAEFDRETTLVVPRADEAEPPPPEPTPPAVNEPEPEAVSPVAAPTSAVIGRYEAEGTSYVMYADGSIEAQSAAGLYRFASMAELKTYIEG